MTSDMWPKLPSQMQMDAWREYQNEAFLDLAEKCDRCGQLYVDDDGCPFCQSYEGEDSDGPEVEGPGS